MADMTTSEKVKMGGGLTSLTLGLVVFFYKMGEILSRHSDWAYVKTPVGVGELFTVLAFALLAVIGAGVTDLAKLLELMKGK